MKFQSLLIVVFLLLGISKSSAQNYELGKVTVAELKEKANPKDTTAPAAIFLKKEKHFLRLLKTKVFLPIMFMNLKLKFIKKKD